MKKAVSFALLVVGINLVFLAISTAILTGSGFVRFFTGSPSDQTIWLLVGGLIATSAGMAGLIRRPRSL